MFADRMFPSDELENWTLDLDEVVRGFRAQYGEYRIGSVEPDPEMEHYDAVVELGLALAAPR